MIEQALAAWTGYYQAAVGVLGFPEREPRVEVVGDTGPMAVFKLADSPARSELRVNLAPSMTEGTRPGSASIRMLIYPA